MINLIKGSTVILDENYKILNDVLFFKKGDYFFDYVFEKENVLKDFNEQALVNLKYSYNDIDEKICTLFRKCNDKIEVTILGYELDDEFQNIHKNREIIENYDSAFFEFDLKKRKLILYTYVSNKKYQFSFDDVTSRQINALKIHSYDIKKFIGFIDLLNSEKTPTVCFRTRFIENKYSWYCLEAVRINDETYYGRLKNIEPLVEEQKAYFARMQFDPLTKTFQKDAIIKYTKDLCNGSNPFTLIAVDMDYFTNINDTMGHFFGDYVIKALSKQLIKVVNKKGKVGRIGGDEFLLVLEGVYSDSDIRDICRDIRFRCDNLILEDGSKFSSSVTMGVVSSPRDGRQVTELSSKLYKALYRGKAKGRDCYIIYIDSLHGHIDVKNPITIQDIKNSSELKISSNVFVKQCIEELFNQKNINKTIKETLEKIGVFFGLDRILIIEGNENDSQIIKKWSLPEYEEIKTENYLSPFILNKLRKENVFSVNDISKYSCKKDPILNKYFKDMNMKATVIVPLDENGELTGMISFDICRKKRVWQRDEIFYLSILGRIINTFLTNEKKEEMLYKVAYYDKIADCWNFRKIQEEFERQIKTSDEKYYLLGFDLVGFKNINVRYGYQEGNYILREVAKVLNKFIYSDDLYCRISDDKFLLVLKDRDDIDIISRIQNLQQLVFEIKTSNGVSCNLNIKVGISFVDKKNDFIHCVDKVSLARKHSYETGNSFEFYSVEIESKKENERKLEEAMREGLNNHEFKVYVQPCYNIEKNTISSLEALVRWQKDDKLIMPGSFIPLFEKNGFINELDFYVYEEVCKKIRYSIDTYGYSHIISVNVSRYHVLDDRFIIRLKSILEKYNVEPHYLSLELTESLFINNENAMVDFVKALRKEGFKIYMDDFGVAYSNLVLLSMIDIDVLKLDKSFLEQTYLNNRKRIIINSVIKMAKDLGINVLSEGIEKESQLLELKSLKCDFAQGYHYARPMPFEMFEEKYLKNN